jgi:hypothetical protein
MMSTLFRSPNIFGKHTCFPTPFSRSQHMIVNDDSMYTKCSMHHLSQCYHTPNPPNLPYTLDLFHSQHSSNLTPLPPNTSKALPIVKSTLPPLKLSTNSRSCRLRPPPAYVTGIADQADSLRTSSSSMPCWRPSLSAAWIRNSEQ